LETTLLDPSNIIQTSINSQEEVEIKANIKTREDNTQDKDNIRIIQIREDNINHNKEICHHKCKEEIFNNSHHKHKMLKILLSKYNLTNNQDKQQILRHNSSRYS